MINKSIRILVFWVTISLFSSTVSAQDITMEQTLTYINGKLGNGYSVDVIRGVIVAKFYEGTEIFREDQVQCKSLDLSSMRYDSETKLFSVNCNGTSKCVDRQLYVRKVQRDYARFSLPLTLSGKSIEGMKNAFTHMVRLALDPKYKSSEPFEK